MHPEKDLHSWHRTVSVGLLILALAFPSAAGVKLAWDPNPEIDLAGYKVYFGTSPGVYGPPITVQGNTAALVNPPTPGIIYYFAVTAYNTAGDESGFSNEVTTLYGDVNLDGVITVLDLQKVVNDVLSENGYLSNDLNGDSVVDVIDIQIVVNLILAQP